MSLSEELEHLRARCAELERLIDDDPCTPLQRAIVNGLGVTYGQAAVLCALALAYPRPLTGPRLAGLYEAYPRSPYSARESNNPTRSLHVMICRIRSLHADLIAGGGVGAHTPYRLTEAGLARIAQAAGDHAPVSLKRYAEQGLAR